MPQQLQSHFYDAFLSGETSDISLRVSGSWHAVYRLHRLVLTQAVRVIIHCASRPLTGSYVLMDTPSQGFFRSLFTSGFLETSRHVSTMRGEVAVRFDHDPNITRPGKHP
jgi:hypothetical protein